LRLILVGDQEPELDPLPQECINMIRDNSSIIHINWSEHVKYFMAIADIFIFPSHREGFPNVLLQAGAMQLPIICSRIAGNVDIVSNEETGLIFDTANEEQMLKLINRAIENPDKMRNMADNLLKRISKDFRRENIWQNILAAYKSSLN
ncbi:MAG TPA: glycosyltransferase, partial [Ferruginibacter sp.]|nr:glycosyltransferase [Ferruginibacter sp.]